jgi:hypothetical protein
MPRQDALFAVQDQTTEKRHRNANLHIPTAMLPVNNEVIEMVPTAL